jgi:Mg-chelatase subunit ChlD
MSVLSQVEHLPAQETADEDAGQLRVTGIDLTDYPTVSILLVAFDSDGARLNDLSRLTLSENGVPITDYSVSETNPGLDLIFVVDANESITSIDDADDGRTRLEKLQSSLVRYATQFMSPAGLDRVSVIVPDGEAPRFLVQDADRPADLVAAIEGYAPLEFGETPLQEMLALALTHASASQEEGRAQAIVLITDGALLNQQLDYEELLATAQALQIPFHAIIVGARADPEEIENVARLYQSLGGSYTHMPNAPDADPLYQQLQELATQYALSYTSSLEESGPLGLQLRLGELTQEVTQTLNLDLPAVTLASAATEIRRVGALADTPLAELQPAVQPVAARLSWPGEPPIAIQQATLLVNGEPQPSLSTPVADADGSLQLEWDISALDAGAYTLSARLVDALGRTIESEPLAITISVIRPDAPAPTPDSTPEALPGEPSPIVARLEENPELLVAGCGGLILLASGLLLFFLLRRRKRKSAERKAEEAARAAALGEADAGEESPPGGYVVLLKGSDGSGEPIRIAGADVTIGRDPRVVDIPLADDSVARLHARIRYIKGDYWLYDEGSATGTYLNFTRVGLAPQRLQEGSDVHVGRVHLRFHHGMPDAGPAGPAE